uniref:NAD-dependent epimerase/dehydratase family protein n=1 Tax=Streptomyces neyagawaensis TaxID=42238 RepID=UPI000AD8FF9D
MTSVRFVPSAPRVWERALVTGGAGFLGSHLCERLLERGVAVDCVDNLSTGSPDNIAHLREVPGLRLVAHGIADPTAPGPTDLLDGPYDVVLHFAGPAAPADRRRLPLETLEAGSVGTRNALGRWPAGTARCSSSGRPRPSTAAPAVVVGGTTSARSTRWARAAPTRRPTASPRRWSPRTRAPS